MRRPPATAFTPLHVLVLLSLALGAIVWGVTFILGGERVQLQRYLALLGFYGASSAVFVVSRIRRGKLQLFELPVFMTAMFFLQFGLLPLRNFIDPAQLVSNLSPDGEELGRALSYVILGMMAFWIGCELARRKKGDRISPGPGTQSIVPEVHKARAVLLFAALFAVAFVTRFYLLKSQLFSYTASGEKYFENLASMQVLNYVSQLGTLALIIVAIERYRERYDPFWRLLFVAVLSSEVCWGLISGMKGLVLQNFIVVALVSSFVKRRLNLRWLVIPFFALVLLYPVSDAYRSLVRGGGAEVTSFEGGARAGQMAFSKMEEGKSTTGDLWREGLDHTLRRLDLLTSVAEVLSLGPRASMVKGDIHWWMLPFYPFVPRFLWPSKPILQEGGWFTVALRGGSENLDNVGSSTAITYPGDLYLQFGLLGIPVGMFVLGIVAQWFTNRVSGGVESRDLFVYAALFLFGFPLEPDVFSMWTGLIKLLAILYVLRRLIYGSSTQRKRLATSFPVLTRRP
ncbi:MAG: hypothetical protein LAO04_00510 [Acidobacteriia bacterium]|nr:hypothetical protein [Terriglobia bacterium]